MFSPLLFNYNSQDSQAVIGQLQRYSENVPGESAGGGGGVWSHAQGRDWTVQAVRCAGWLL